MWPTLEYQGFCKDFRWLQLIYLVCPSFLNMPVHSTPPTPSIFHNIQESFTLFSEMAELLLYHSFSRDSAGGKCWDLCL